MATQTETKVDELVEAVGSDLADVTAAIDSAAAKVRELAPCVRGIPKLATSCRAWIQQLENLSTTVSEEADRVRDLMLGEGPEIVTSVDETKVRELRAGGEG